MFWRTNATWGLGRISSRKKLANQKATALTFTYEYDAFAGANSDIYIIGMRAGWSTYYYKANP